MPQLSPSSGFLIFISSFIFLLFMIMSMHNMKLKNIQA